MGENVVNIACGDCGSADCQWATVSKGLYLCNECSFIHRSLGPQYSRIKSLKHSKWHPNLRQMITMLAAGPANNVWEHTLLNPSKSDVATKKPVPGDSLEVIKKRFITLKHSKFQFVLRQKQETFDVRNEELHSTVRTSDIGTALRLIASGADPNFFHPDRGTRPLHVACRSGQALQVELLFVHGAQIDAPDYLGQTPADHAKAAGFKDLAVRIEELQYHLTDQLSLFACGECPDHTSSKHILIPSMGTTSAFGQEEKIKKLPAHMLEQLTSDLYDEVERRQTEKILISLSPEHARFSIAFLPVNPNFHSVRNQTRQKFARLTDSELSSLIIVILRESKRRHLNGSTFIEPDQDIFLDNNVPHSENDIQSTILNEDDEFPLYDSVASDDDIVMSEVQTIQTQKPRVDSKESNLNSNTGSAIRNTMDSPYLTKLAEERIAQLETSNLVLKYELKVIKQMLSNYIQSSMEKSRRSPPSLTEMDHLNSNNLESSDTIGRNTFRSSGNVVMRQHSPSELSSHLKKFRSVSMYAEKINPPDGTDVAARPNTSGECTLPGHKDVGTSALVQATTRDIVELIKILIEFAGANDYQGVQLTANKVYDAAQGMSAVLMEKESDTNIKNGLHNVIVQVLRMKSEIPLLSNSQLLNAATLNYNSDGLKKKDTGSQLYVQKVIGKARVAFQIGKTLPTSFRIEQLQGLINLLRENRGELLNALERDLRKPRTEGILCELDVVENEARSMLTNLRTYASTEKLPINLLTPADRGYIRKEPYGVVLIMATWNYPILLCLQPLVGAIAAGNSVIIKPSEVSAFSSNTLAQLIPQYLDRECFHVILGDVEETQELLQHKFDYIFFTGSSSVGKKILAAAAPHLTPVTLELGGKNPCYIDDSADIQTAAKRIIWGKFLNAGQTCISVDYIICSPLVSEKFLRIAYQILNEWHGTTARSCPNLSRIVSAKHFTRLSNLLDETKGRVILGGNVNQRELWIQPTVVIDVDATDPLMEDEIFGPILPIITVNSVDDAISFIRTRPSPLVVYTFSKDDGVNERLIGSTNSGGVCINDVILHATWSLLPFGGIGTAGMGVYHGKYSFDTFSHRRSVLHRGFSYLSEKSYEIRYPPYTLQKTKFISLAMKHFDKFFIAESKLYKFFLVFLAVSFYVGFRRVLNIPTVREILLAMRHVFLRRRFN